MISEMLELFQTRRDFFQEIFIEHLQISIITICLAVFLGLAIRVFISEYPGISKTVMGIINFIYTIPSISLLGFLIPLSGMVIQLPL